MSILAEDDRLSYRVAFLLALVALLAVPVHALRILAALVILCFLPAAPFAARTGLSFVSAFGITVVLSPVLVALPVLGVMSLDLPLDMAVWAIVGIAMAQFLVYGTQGGLSVRRSDRRLLFALGAVLAVAAFLTLWLPATETAWRFREDSWFHAAVFNRLDGHGLPAVDPYFSPLHLQYMYIYHVLLLAVSKLTGSGPFTAMIVTNFMALVGCVFGFAFLAGRFTQNGAARWLGTCLFVLGMNGLFYLFVPARIARTFLGETAGSAALERSSALTPAGYETAARLLSVENNQFLLLEKFMVGTALPMTIGVVCVVLGLIATSRRGGWSWLSLLLYAVGLGGLLFQHVIVGITVVAAVTVTIVLSLLSRGGRAGPVWWQIALTALVAAVAIPYLLSIRPANGVLDAVGFEIGMGQVVGILAGVLPALVPAAWYVLRGESLGRTGGGPSASGLLAAWAAVVWLLATTVDLPTDTEILFVFPLYAALSGLAVGTFDRALTTRWHRPAVIVYAYVLLCTVPVNATFFVTAFRDDSRFVVTLPEESLYDWITKFSRKDALFLEADDTVRIPVLAARDLYWGAERYAQNWRYPEAEVTARRALRDAVFGTGPIPEHVFRHAASLDRPLYVVLRDVHADGAAQFQRISQHPRLSGKFMNDRIVVFEVNLKGL
jgi:hypothetical protein